MRSYRIELKQGQTSPPSVIVRVAASFLRATSNILGRSVSVLDVGCGSGEIMRMVKEQVTCVSRCVGIDYSSSTVEILQNKNIYDQVVWCQADTLPFVDQEFDCVFSIECLEHLYNNQVIQGLNELKRVSKHILISTPALHTVINVGWLTQEITHATYDPDPIDYTEYCILEGAVHKSIVYPDSMMAAGFIKDPRNDAQFYVANSDEIDTSLVQFVGIDQEPLPNSDQEHDYRPEYLQLLKNSLQLDERIVK